MAATKPSVRKRASGSRARHQVRNLYRNAILDASERVFAERGFHATRIQDIAHAARTAVGTMYNHFNDKSEVLCALLDERTQEILAQLGPRAGESKEFAVWLEERIRRMLAYVERHRGLFAIVMNLGGGAAGSSDAAISERAMRRVQRFRAAWQAIVDEGVREGALETTENPALLGALLAGTVRALTHDALADPETPLIELAPAIVRLFLRGAGRRKPG